jgi:hypothetical protein
MPNLPIGIPATVCVDEQTNKPVAVEIGGDLGSIADIRICSTHAMHVALFALQSEDKPTRDKALVELGRMPEFEEIRDEITWLPAEVPEPEGWTR